METADIRLFDAVVRPNNDTCEVDAVQQQNDLLSQYAFGVEPNPAHRQAAHTLVDTLPNLRFQGSVPPAAFAEAADVRNSFQWTPRAKKNLTARTYQAVPNTRAGAVRPDEEFSMIHGEVDRLPTGARQLTETDMTHFEPLAAGLRTQHVQPPALQSQDTRANMRDPGFLAAQGYVKNTQTGTWSR